jgi:urease accessory protein UreF
MYAAWHAWALTNHEAVKLAQRAHTDSTSATAKQACTSRQGEEEGRSNNENEGNGSNVMAPLAPSSGVGADTSFTYESVVAHVTSAISGFVRAIALGQAHSVSNVLQVHRCIIKKVFVV